MTPLRLPDNISEALDRALGDGASKGVAIRLGEWGDGEAAAIVLARDGVRLLVRDASWWSIRRDARGELELSELTAL